MVNLPIKGVPQTKYNTVLREMTQSKAGLIKGLKRKGRKGSSCFEIRSGNKEMDCFIFFHLSAAKLYLDIWILPIDISFGKIWKVW